MLPRAGAGADTRDAGAREGDGAESVNGTGSVQTDRETTLSVLEKEDDANNGSYIADRSKESSLTLESFRSALAAHPDATRFIIAENGSIQPQDEDLDDPEKNQSENQVITQALRMALQRENSAELVEKLSATDWMGLQGFRPAALPHHRTCGSRIRRLNKTKISMLS